MKVEITSNNVQKVGLATAIDDDSGELYAKITVVSKLHPVEIARLLNLQKNKAPLFFTIGSKQAELDLEFITIKSEKIERIEVASDLVECPLCHGKRTTLDKETRIDIACSKCRGTGLVPVEQQPPKELTAGDQKPPEGIGISVTGPGDVIQGNKITQETPAAQATDALVTSVPVAEVTPESNGKKPKQRSKKGKQAELPVT